MDELTEGRIVHFVLESGECRPAIVVKVWRVTGPGNIQDPPENGCCNLQVFCDSDALGQWMTSVVYSEEPTPGTWHWIEKA